jgi:hypothetical protein
MDDDKIIKIHADIDIEAVQKIADEALSLDDNAALFGKLAEFAHVKAQIKDLGDLIDKAEIEIKGIINSKAKALYGPNWQAIAGPGYKISRSFTGAKYEQVGAAPEEFIIVKQSVDSKAVDNYVKGNSALPEGIAVNQARGESIRMTIKEVEHDPTA